MLHARPVGAAGGRGRAFAAVLAMVTAFSALAGLTTVVTVGPARGAVLPVENFAGYQPQTTCSPAAKPGTVALGRWLVSSYGGRFGSISRTCTGRSVSEHKEGRAFDWTLDARKAADRARAARFLTAAFATGPSGQKAELARRMGIMYVIWNDRIYAAYRGFAPRAYLSSSCRTLRKCSRTLRHRDHMHVSLLREAAAGRTSWYAGRVPGVTVLPVATPPSPWQPPVVPPVPSAPVPVPGAGG
jgi:hypothetical protein